MTSTRFSKRCDSKSKNKRVAAPVRDVAEDLRLASEPTTAPELLASLAEFDEPEVRLKLAVNPNTPDHVLHGLWAAHHPLATLENPILAYRTLATGKKFHQLLPEGVKLAFYDALRKEDRHEELEAYLPEIDRCEWLGYYSRRSDELRTLPEPVLDSASRYLATDASVKVRKRMVGSLPKQYLEYFADDPDREVRLAAVNRLPSCTYWRLDEESEMWSRLAGRFSADPDETVRLIVAGCDVLTPEAHLRLARDPSMAVREKLADQGRGKELPEEGWRLLMEDGDNMCLRMAKNKGCHEAVRLDLTAHPISAVRVAAWNHMDLAENSVQDRLTLKMEELLGDADNLEEQLALAANRTITTPVFQRLLGCVDQVTRVLAMNCSLKDDALAALLQSADVQTAVNAMERASSDALLDAGAGHRFAEVRALVPGKKGRHASRLRLNLARDPSPLVRDRVRACLHDRLQHYDGENISEILTILAKDPLSKIRARVVSDYRLSRDELIHLAHDPSVRVRLAMLRHRRLTSSSGHLGLLDHKKVGVRAAAAELLLDRGWLEPPAYAEKIASDPSMQVRNVAAKSRFTPHKVLQKLIRDESPEVRQTLLQRDMPRTRTWLKGWVKEGKVKEHPLTLLASSRNPYRRAAAAGVYRAGKRRLRKLAVDRCWYVRAMTARNGWNIEPHLLTKLLEDSHPMVRQEAQKRVQHNPGQFSNLAKEVRP